MKPTIITLSLWIFFSPWLCSQTIDSIGEFSSRAARQAVAVDVGYIYAISNTTIEKMDKITGKPVQSWQDTTNHFQHLNSGVILDGLLYCAHSNYPDIPMVSSIEVFDPETLKPVESHSLGIDIGSATWIDWFEGHWYVAFAHYDRFKDLTGTDNRWTQLVKYSEKWERRGGWILPPELLNRFDRMSNSGGFITSAGQIYVTGHDFKEVYVLEFPPHGYTLKWTKTFPAPFEGQGIAIDPDDPTIIFGIQRSQKKVIRGRLSITE